MALRNKQQPAQDTFTLCGEVLGSLAAMFDAHDKYSDAHHQRIWQMAVRLCEVIKMKPEDINAVALAAMVHDIGNVGIPPAVLNKNGQLSQDDWKLICEHPNIGADLVSKFAGLDDVAAIVRHHHERWNGLGYPSRLKENQIPVGARILSICESVDAMLSYRPFKKSMTVTDAKADIEKNSGVMYDPAIASALLKNWETVISPVAFI